jgi:formylglycine-generating enzyme required for sulfatase activity
VARDGYWIDKYEVTEAQYATFLAANYATSAQIAECSWNGAFEPGNWAGATKPDHPVVSVDWCDAHAFCAWAGKRLCGNRAGGAVAFTDHAKAAHSQWYAACSSDGANLYPYAESAYDASACNGKDYAAGTTLPVGSLAACTAGSDGPMDMSGNVWEWEDSCSPDTNAQLDDCRLRGGSFRSVDGMRCNAGFYFQNRSFQDKAVGFRCCRDE